VTTTIMTDARQGECRLFLTYRGIRLPLTLLTPLEPEQIANRNTYIRGYFDAQDRLIGLQKIVYGETELEHRYRYDEHGVLRSAAIIDAEGETAELLFDASGERCG
jgi:hypothetical protein